MVDGCFKTDDMALAVVLRSCGYRSKLEFMLGSNRMALWVFDASDDQATDDLEDIVREYAGGETLVEPKGFLQLTKEVREELYSFLGTRSGRRVSDKLVS